ncbi:MAG: hypothetical protein QXZ09_06410 [Candidatus Methanomethylicaceae archaeon]
MKKTVTLTIVLRGEVDRLRKEYAPVIEKAHKAYFVSASGKVIPADAVKPTKSKGEAI